MSNTFAATGRNTHVFASIDSGSTYIEIFGIKSVSFGGRKKDAEDKTTLLSANGYKETQPTLRSGGTCTLNLFFNPTDAGQILLAASFDTVPDQELFIKVVYDGPTLGLTTGPIKTFKAWLLEYPDPPADIAKLTEQSIQLTVDGPITTIAGS